MGNGAIDGNMLVQKDGNKYTYYLRMQGLKFMGLYGHLWNVLPPTKEQVENVANYNAGIKYDNQKNMTMSISKKFMDTDLEKKQREFPRVIKFEGDRPLNQIVITVWVDAMDAIASGGSVGYDSIVKGKGDQRGIIQIDWHNPTNKATPEEISDYGVVIPPAEKMKLNEVITAAEKAKEGVEVSADGTDKAKEVKWVTEAEMKSLDEAIKTAKGVQKEDLTKDQQKKVNDAVAALNAAKDKFEAAKKAGTKKPDKANKGDSDKPGNENSGKMDNGKQKPGKSDSGKSDSGKSGNTGKTTNELNKKPGVKPAKPSNLKKPVKTGDSSMLAGYAMLIVSLAGATYFVARKKNEK